MNKWLQTGSVVETRDNEPSTSANVSSGPKCAKLGSDDKIQRGVGKSQVKKRKYDDDDIKFGFTCSGDQECPKPRCVIYGYVLANSSLKPSLLRRHLETRHPTQTNLSTFSSVTWSSRIFASRILYRQQVMPMKMHKKHRTALATG
jgi:hypothetical protein